MDVTKKISIVHAHSVCLYTYLLRIWYTFSTGKNSTLQVGEISTGFLCILSRFSVAVQFHTEIKQCLKKKCVCVCACVIV